VAGSCEHSNEFSVFIICWKIRGQLSDWQLSKNFSLWGYLLNYVHRRRCEDNIRMGLKLSFLCFLLHMFILKNLREHLRDIDRPPA
jgi:hypothetical protein